MFSVATATVPSGGAARDGPEVVAQADKATLALPITNNPTVGRCMNSSDGLMAERLEPATRWRAENEPPS
jgi:hypothetical protein